MKCIENFIVYVISYADKPVCAESIYIENPWRDVRKPSKTKKTV